MKTDKIALLLAVTSIIFLAGSFTDSGYAKDVYSLFGKLFLSGRVEYDFTDTRDFLTDTEIQDIEQNQFDFDRLFRRGFHSVLIIEETAGNIKNILSLGDVPTTFTSYTFDRIDMSGIRWDVRSEHSDVIVLMVPGPLNPIIGQDVESSGVGLRQVTKFGNSKIGASWYFRETPILGLDAETNFANYGLKAEFGLTPKSALKRDLRARADATASVFKVFRTIGDTIIRAEAFRIGPRYDASRAVTDNDDQDRYTDNTFADPPSFIIPGDLDKNDNGIFDYEDDILLYDVDEDFLDERDDNNNGVRDQEENDKDADYEFDVGLRGARVLLEYKKSRRGTSTDIDLGIQYAKNLGTEDIAAKAFGDIVYKQNLSVGSIILENELKYVKDEIPDDTWYYAGTLSNDEVDVFRRQDDIQEQENLNTINFFGVRGGYEVEKKRFDPLSMQNDLINTAKITFDYTKIKKMVTTIRAKIMYDIDFDGDNEHYQVGIFKTHYRMRPSKSIEIIPMYKYLFRNGFKMAEERVKHRAIEEKKDDETIEYDIRLRDVEQMDVRDQSQAFILKTVYQFTKTIKITGGVQLLLFNNMMDNEQNFTRYAILGELEKNFVAYEKDLFLHMGTRYIDQRAKSPINNQNFMETFVRVFAKF
ncbi:TPA: hypothetical protein EYP66_19380 [Candidatus Poribacteria bacterium]|nr:hypothetical protein [Candidatus Poribacteria bacterium]